MNHVSCRARRGLVLSLPLCALTLFHVQTAGAQAKKPRLVKNPPLLALKRKAPPGALAKTALAQEASREASLDLNIVYTDGKLWNPGVGRYDRVQLRSYQGASVDPNNPFISPMLEIKPGDTIRLSLNNKLPPDPRCIKPEGGSNSPQCFNGTNLHTHGLWVNPAGNGDNVLLSINPGVSFTYEYNVPSDHPAGTFWYHTHRHGSTALQVSSGMAGALIIRGDRPPTPGGTGDIDTLLKPTRTQSFKERVLVLQQIQYACRDAKGKIKTVSASDRTYRCDEGDVGRIEGYDLFSPGSWPASGRYTSINGQVLPTFDGVSAGQIERWRVIHGGVRDTINLQFRKLKSGPFPQLVRAADRDKFVQDNCTGAPLPQHLIAADGLTMAAAMKTDQTIYQPAYRWDTLMVFPEPGEYCVFDAAAPPAASVGQHAPSRQLLGMVKVTAGRPVPPDITAYLATELAAAATVNMPADVRDKVAADLRNGLRLSSFVPHPDIKDREVTGTQQVTFNIYVPNDPRYPADSTQFQVNGRSFDPSRVDRVLKLGGVDEWTLTSDFVSHPFHIHVNPFQVVKILDPSGKDVSAPGAVDNAGGTVDPQYPGLKGVWKDTLWVKNLVPPGKPPGKYTVVVRTRYERYIGDYVLHCHILDHEDQGMMQVVRVAVPDGAGGTASAHHH
jgi:FtsP/CotA-like multicopper oxidase with cupredoxin domain